MYNQQQYNQFMQQNNPFMQQTQNILPPQQIMTANGFESVRTLKMSPNSSVLVADDTRPILYKCTSDSIGTVTVQQFDISPHVEPQPVDQTQVTALMAELAAGVQTMTTALEELKTMIKEVKQDEPAARTKSAGKS